MAGRFSRSWALVKASAEVLRQDKELLVFPLLSTIAAVLVIVSFLVPLQLTGALDSLDQSPGAAITVGFLFYLTQYFVIFFFNTALVGAAMIRLDGGDPTVQDGLRVATSRLGAILGYAAIAATVGMILRVIEERFGFIGRWIAGLFGVAFTIATFLTVPILVTRNIGPIEAVKQSAALLRKTWGENVIGNVGLGFAFFFIHLAIIAATVVLVIMVVPSGSASLLLAVLGLGALALMGAALIQSALQGIYSAALYRHATGEAMGGPFASELLDGAFKART